MRRIAAQAIESTWHALPAAKPTLPRFLLQVHSPLPSLHSLLANVQHLCFVKIQQLLQKLWPTRQQNIEGSIVW